MGINSLFFIVEQTLFVTRKRTILVSFLWRGVIITSREHALFITRNRTILVSFLWRGVIITSREHAQLKTVHAAIWQFI